MARTTLSLVFIFIFAYVTYKVVASVISNRRFKAFAEQNGCKEPYDLTGPSILPGIKRLRRIMNLKKTQEDFLDDIISRDFDKASTITFTQFDGNRPIATVEPANLQAMLANQFKEFDTGPQRRRAFGPLLGNGIFTSDGAHWEHSRALFRPQFARENINDLNMTNRAAKDLIDALGSLDAERWTGPVKMMDLLYNFTLDTATDFLFGESIDSQAAATAERRGAQLDLKKDPERATKLEDAKRFSDCFDIINEYMVTRIRTGSIYWIKDSFAFRKAVRTVFNFTEHFVRVAADPKRLTASSDRKKDSLLNNLANQTQDQQELRNQTLSILVAGRDTTAAMLGWCFERLAMRPDIYSKLRSIVLRDFPPNEDITFEKLKGCRYLQHFLNEVLRLHPTVPFNARLANRDTTLPVGGGPDGRSPIAVRKNTVCLFGVYVMHRRKDLWGEDALEFRPERWEEQRFPAWQFLPFLGGPRICLGQQFALTEASYLLVRIMQQFEAIEPIDREEMGKFKAMVGITMWPRDGAKVRFRKAEG